MTTDILFSGSDLMFQGGDLVVGRSEAQHAACILETHPAEWRQWPLLGVGISSYLLEDIALADLRHRFEVHCQYDNATVDSFQAVVTDDSLKASSVSIRYQT